MNLPTIGIIFALFFCSAWAGICMSGTRISAQSNSSPPHRPKFNSARFNEEKIKDVIAHCKNGTDFNRKNANPRRTVSANSATTTNLLWDSAGGSISGGGRNKNRGNNKDVFANTSQHQRQRQRTTSSTASSAARNRRKKVQFKDTAGTSGGGGGRGGTNDSYDDDMRKIVALARAREAKRLAEEDVMDKLWKVEPSMDERLAEEDVMDKLWEVEPSMDERLAEEDVMDKLWKLEPSMDERLAEDVMDKLWEVEPPAAIGDHHAQTVRPEAGQNNKGKSRNRSGNPSKLNPKKNGGKTNRAAAPARGEPSKQKAEWPQNYQTVRRRHRTRK
uniref:Uncharacterized protein n=1 Tax=Globodera rostochiensis TaxID=31243 RepID=A0A914HKY5_GLORO